MNNKNIVIVTSLLVISVLAVYFLSVNSNNRSRVSPTPTPTPIPTTGSSITPTPTPNPDLSQYQFTTVYDGLLGHQFQYPQNWYFYPATSTMAESAIYSFNINTTPDTGNIPSDQLKIAAVFFSQDDQRNIDISPDDINSQRQITVDGQSATRYILNGRAGTSVSTTVDVDSGTWLLSAYPADSQLIAVYNHFLEQVKLKPETPVIIDSPQAGTTISSPVQITGQASGTWFSEGQLSIRLESATGNLIKQTTVTTQDNWMTEDLVSFNTSLEFNTGATSQGKIIIVKSNPSGLPQNATFYYWPVNF